MRENVLQVDPELLAEARMVAQAEGIELERFVSLALAEKLSAMRPERYFQTRAARADIAKARSVLRRAGLGNPPEPGDEGGPGPF